MDFPSIAMIGALAFVVATVVLMANAVRVGITEGIALGMRQITVVIEMGDNDPDDPEFDEEDDEPRGDIIVLHPRRAA